MTITGHKHQEQLWWAVGKKEIKQDFQILHQQRLQLLPTSLFQAWIDNS